MFGTEPSFKPMLITHEANTHLKQSLKTSKPEICQDEIYHYINGTEIETEIVMMSTLPSLLAPQVVVMTTCVASSDDKVDIIR